MRPPGLTAEALAQQLDAAYAGPAWYGPALRASLRGVSDALADWRPAADRHSIRELALHAAYAKHRVAGRLDPARRSRFARRLGAAWWPAVDPTRSWAEDRRLLEESHAALVAVVLAAPARRLGTSRPGRSDTLADEVLGAAMHDAYHAGQVRLLRRLAPAGLPENG